jgi:pimeloyl-ACP methyl ester carboxylesterase
VADEFGQAGDPCIILLPGGGQSRSAWRRSAERFAHGGHHVLSFDLRGHGESGWANDYSIDAFIGDVVCIARQAPAGAVLAGASIGGIAALIAAGESSIPLARALVLVDVVPQMGEAALDRIRGFMSAAADGFASLEEAAASVRKYLPHRPPRSSPGLRNNMRTGKDGRLYWHWDPAFHAGSKQRAEAGMLRRMAEATRGVEVPVLLVCGARSEVVDEQAVAHLLQLLPQTRFVRVAGAGHMVAGDSNDAFGAAVLDFLRQLPQPP